jgi:hypothetical protein
VTRSRYDQHDSAAQAMAAAASWSSRHGGDGDAAAAAETGKRKQSSGAGGGPVQQGETVRLRLPPRIPGGEPRRFHPGIGSTLTEIYLCHACPHHEIEDGNARPGPAEHLKLRWSNEQVIEVPCASPPLTVAAECRARRLIQMAAQQRSSVLSS